MRLSTFTLALCVAALVTSCGKTGSLVQPVEKAQTGEVVVYVFEQGQGLLGKRVELLELHMEATTNNAGMVRFKVPVGDYTVRAYDINSGGPAWYYDTKVTVKANEATRIEVVNCTMCV